ncbi:hypothetical protein amyaer_1313 [Microcystis aeruginosa NIES-2481]|nr:hypothetical protein amyaer_1313 [Microcystis aeruginosa NIES-2481]
MSAIILNLIKGIRLKKLIDSFSPINLAFLVATTDQRTPKTKTSHLTMKINPINRSKN